MSEDQHSVLTDISTAYALSLQQRILHPETTPEEKERLQAELNALLAQWSANLKAAFTEIAGQVIQAFKPLLDLFAEWADRIWQRAYPTPRPRFPIKDKRGWQHAQKRRAQVRRQRRAQKRALATLRMQYQPRRRAHYV